MKKVVTDINIFLKENLFFNFEGDLFSRNSEVRYFGKNKDVGLPDPEFHPNVRHILACRQVLCYFSLFCRFKMSKLLLITNQVQY